MSGSGAADYLVFEVSGRVLSVPLAIVEEVVPSGQITPVPASPAFLLGLSAVRGKVMGVIDAASRYGFPPGLRSHFLVCQVRGNCTAIAIDRPVTAGALKVRPLDSFEHEHIRANAGLDPRFVKGSFELLEQIDESGATQATGTYCLLVDPDLFVSAEMASRVGEAA